MSAPPPLPPMLYERLIDRALREDLGRAGDLTTDSIVAVGERATAVLAARAAGRIAGLEVACAVFRRLDPRISVDARRTDGDDVEAGAVLVRLGGSARALLTAERTALNLLGRLSGIATVTREAAREAARHGATVVCTRKTTAGLRALEKYAVRVGGGRNHRFGLDDAVLIKDNHLAVAGSVAEAVARARRRLGHLVVVVAEVDDCEQLEQALAAGVDAVLLDNFEVEELRSAAALARAAGVTTEASGGIRPDAVAEVAATGVDLISLGWLTHSAAALDVALDVVHDAALDGGSRAILSRDERRPRPAGRPRHRQHEHRRRRLPR